MPALMIFHNKLSLSAEERLIRRDNQINARTTARMKYLKKADASVPATVRLHRNAAEFGGAAYHARRQRVRRSVPPRM